MKIVIPNNAIFCYCKECNIKFYIDKDEISTIIKDNNLKIVTYCPNCNDEILISGNDKHISIPELDKLKNTFPDVGDFPFGPEITCRSTEITTDINTPKTNIENTTSTNDVDISKLDIKSPILETCFHGETWYRCPGCNKSFEVYAAEFGHGFTIINQAKRIYKHKCGCIIKIS